MNQCDIDVEQKELEILELELKEDVNTCSNVVQQDSIDDEQKEIVNLEDNVVEQRINYESGWHTRCYYKT